MNAFVLIIKNENKIDVICIGKKALNLDSMGE
jgi:hypothetical protein